MWTAFEDDKGFLSFSETSSREHWKKKREIVRTWEKLQPRISNKSQFWEEVFNIDFSGWCVTFLIRIDKSIYVKNARAKLSSIRIIFFSDDDKQKHWATQNSQTQQTNITYWNRWEKLSGKKASLTRAKVKTSVKPAWAISCLSRSQSVFNLNCKRSNKTFGAAVVNHPGFSAFWSKWLQRLWL